MFGRHRRERRAKSAGRIADDIRAAIARLDEQRRAAANSAGRAIVNQAEVARVCDEQLRILAEAFGDAENAEVLAGRAARSARRDDDPDLVAFEQTAAGLRDVQQALGAAADPLHALRDKARGNVEQARQVLGRAEATLDEQLREQIRLLTALERAERARVARAFRDSF